MIVYPEYWCKNYNDYDIDTDPELFANTFIDFLKINIEEIKVSHLAYSGGVDSTILLCLLTDYFGVDKVHTYTISLRDDHPDILFARQGAEFYRSIHHEFIVEPEDESIYENKGDNAVKQFYDKAKNYTDKMICGDGIDEFMCGYYLHCDESEETYRYFISRLLPDHLVPLHKNSGEVKVFLPYLESYILEFIQSIDLKHKVDSNSRKKIVMLAAKLLGIPSKFIDRNKYGFVDAFREIDK